MAIFLALLSSALWGTSDFCGGTLTRRRPAVTVTLLSELIGLSGVVVAAVATNAFDAASGYLGWGLLGAVAGSIGIVAFYQALATGTMGVVAPIASLGVIVPVAVGLVAGDRPSVLQDAGIVVAIAGVVLAGGPELQRGDGAPASARPLLLAMVAAVGFGVVFVALDHGARTSTVMTLLVMRGAAALMMAAVAALSATSLRVSKPDLPMLVVVGAFDVGANATFGYATRHGLLAVVAVLSSLYPAVTVVLARAIHAERLARIQLVGVVGAIGGVALIAS
ncbi:MAG TPA: EamA family transporter [Mycobacteriales bacterium]|jgi:drug/metabolite transporter (DMT)-like permease|nr:EamA family transporter [Mycobacteriales bacterium]